ncbi:MAG: type II toxin-antitoxin system RatA family toxin [Amphiplicatus sp.]
MTTRNSKTIVPYAAEEMFDLVADIERYPEFIPHCAALRVLSVAEEGARAVMTAEMIVAYHALRDKFKCRVETDRAAMTIRADYLEGPFRKLHNLWRFADADEGSEVDFTIEFEFKNFILQGLASAMFEQVFARMAEAFVRRAHDIYG